MRALEAAFDALYRVERQEALGPDAVTPNGKPRHTHPEEGTRVSLETVRRLTCDTSVVPVLVDE